MNTQFDDTPKERKLIEKLSKEFEADNLSGGSLRGRAIIVFMTGAQSRNEIASERACQFRIDTGSSLYPFSPRTA